MKHCHSYYDDFSVHVSSVNLFHARFHSGKKIMSCARRSPSKFWFIPLILVFIEHKNVVWNFTEKLIIPPKNWRNSTTFQLQRENTKNAHKFASKVSQSNRTSNKIKMSPHVPKKHLNMQTYYREIFYGNMTITLLIRKFILLTICWEEYHNMKLCCFSRTIQIDITFSFGSDIAQLHINTYKSFGAVLRFIKCDHKFS